MFQSDTAYDSFMGRFSYRLAPVFVDFAGVQDGQRVLDVGAGTGALMDELLRRSAQASAAEPSAAFVESLCRRFPGVDVREAGAEELPWPDGSFDAALAQLVVSFMADAPAGVREMQRVVRPGGLVAVCMWDRDGGMEMLAAIDRTRDALGHARVAGKYRARPEMEELLGPGAEIELLSVTAPYGDFEDFWTALVGGAGPAGVWAASLDGEQRKRARAELHHQLGEPSGPFELTGRAWAAKVRRG
jgi:SAM-dependent methyltransferase